MDLSGDGIGWSLGHSVFLPINIGWGDIQPVVQYLFRVHLKAQVKRNTAVQFLRAYFRVNKHE